MSQDILMAIAGEDIKKFDIVYIDASGIVYKQDPWSCGEAIRNKVNEITCTCDTGKCALHFEGAYGEAMNKYSKWPDKPSTLARQVGGDHYKRLKIQPWEVIDAWGLDFYLGNAIKRIARNKIGQDRIEDLEKAIHEIEHEIELLRGENNV